jgi:hypothetical protein
VSGILGSRNSAQDQNCEIAGGATGPNVGAQVITDNHREQIAREVAQERAVHKWLRFAGRHGAAGGGSLYRRHDTA